jgi:hypothetical protein
MGATRRSLQAQPKILKKLLDHQIDQKKYVDNVKKEKEQKIRMRTT